MKHFILLTGFAYLTLFISVAVSDTKCPDRTSLNNYCRKSCKTDEDCKASKRRKFCRCDGDCGLSCVNPAVTCKIDPHEKPKRGSRRISGKKYGDTVTYSCKAGYTLTGTKEMRCSGIGKWKPWDKGKPRCSRRCRDPGRVPNGRLSGTDFGVRSSIRIICFPGYRRRGAARITCLENLKWNLELPTCEVVGCEKPKLPRNVRIHSGEKERYSFGDEVSFGCRPGYASRQRARATCEGGKWSKYRFECRAKSCGRPDTISDGRIIGLVYSFRSRVNYKCNEGYELRGSSYRICQANQRWSGRNPRCEVKSCGRPPPLPNGRFKGIGYTYRSELTAECDSGYLLNGNARIRCNLDKKWSSDTVKCVEMPKDCDNAPAIENAILTRSLYYHKEAVVFRCNSGVSSSMGKAQTCQDGIVVGEPPKCILDERYRGCYKSTHNYDRIYQSISDVKACIQRCLRDGKPYAGIRNSNQCWCSSSRLRKDELKDESKCDKPCLDNKVLSCGGQTWMSVYITGCIFPQAPALGSVLKNTYADGDQITYSCNSGYKLVGAKPSCRGTRVEGQIPKCVDERYRGCYKHTNDYRYRGIIRDIKDCIEKCVKEGKPYAGIRNSNECWCSSTKCDERCLEQGVFNCGGQIWMSVYITGCIFPTAPQFGSVEKEAYANEERVKYFCKRGYRQSGDGQICRGTEFEESPPECKRITCDSPNIPNAVIPERNFKSGDLVSIECVQGYTHSGSSTITCQESGRWTDFPVCTEDKPIQVDSQYVGCFRKVSAMVDFARLDSGDEYSVQTCVNLCLERNRRTRLNNGMFAGLNRRKCFCGDDYGSKEVASSWCSPDNCPFDSDRPCGGGALSVYRTGCTEPKDPVNGFAVQRFYYIGESAEYPCPASYSLSGTPQKCEAYRWVGKVPPCVKNKCEEPDEDPNGTIKIYSYEVGGRVVYSCHRGYTLVGKAVRTCKSTKYWSDAAPKCQQNCKEMTIPEGGRFIYHSRALNHGSAAVLRCNEGHKQIGTLSFYCNNGKWLELLKNGYCAKVCSKVTNPINGQHRTTKIHDKLTAIFTCRDGYVLKGDKELTCTEGRWSGKVPRCEQKSTNRKPCPPLEVKDNALEVIGGDSNRDVTMFGCPKQRSILGSAVLLCIGGKWHSERPKCVTSDCDDCVLPRKTFRELCDTHDTVFIGEIQAPTGEDGTVKIRTKYRYVKSTKYDARLHHRGRWRMKVRKMKNCFCPRLIKGRDYLIFINLIGDEKDIIKFAFPMDVDSKNISFMSNICDAKRT